MNSIIDNYNHVIKLDNVSVAYSNKPILNQLNLSIEAGEFVTVLGQSGSGKTTLLRLLNGLTTPSSGIVSIRGNNIANMDQVQLRRTMGYVIQGAGLFPHLRIKDNIAYVLSLQKVSESSIKQRISELLDIVQLDSNLLNRYPHQLSGGQKQRVGIARALAAKPDILLMDEPFGAVDELTRLELQKQITKIHQQLNVTVIFVTHDVFEAFSLGSSMLIMHQGKIEQYANTQTVMRYPATEFTASLIKKGLAFYESSCIK